MEAKALNLELRAAEKIMLLYLLYGVLEALAFPESLAGRVTVAMLNSASAAVIALLARLGQGTTRPLKAETFDGPRGGASSTGQVAKHSSARDAPPSQFLATVRDWFPAVVILLAYRESGLFYLADPRHRLDYLFVHWDTVLLHNRWALAVLYGGAPWLQRYLEFCYLLCYPLVPLGVGALYLLARQPQLAPAGALGFERRIDQFWTAVLLALFTCYATCPFFPSHPPRSFFHDLAGPAVQPLFRKMNFWVLGQYGIVTSVFPSGHVAAVTAVSLSVRLHWPRVGILFGIAALSIACATIVGRYHYAADAVAGALIGIAAFLVSRRVHHV
jgi:membrane-associated phospholipid phosphatase